MRSAAYATAVKFAEDGLEFLLRVNTDYWATDHKVAFELTFSRAVRCASDDVVNLTFIFIPTPII